MIPPNAVWAERALLGCLVRDNLPWPEGLLPSHFFDPLNIDIAAACKRLKDDGKDLDEFTVADAITSAGDKTGVDAHYINGLTSADCPLTYSRNWAESIIRTATLRKLTDLGRNLSDLAAQPDADPRQLADFTEGTLRVTVGDAGPKSSDIPTPLNFRALVDFVPEEDKTCVLGNRYLCEGGSCMIVAQTGAGKSAIVAHAALSYAIGRDFFGVRSKKGPLTSVIIQSENDGGDCAEAVQGCIDGMGLPRDSQLVGQMADRVFFYREAVKTGEAFGKLLRDLITLHKADLVFVDPLLGFAGVDLSDQEAASHFLRQIVQPVLADTGVVLFSVHHTTKPPKEKGNISMADLAYAGAGSAELANWHRAVIVLQKDATPEGEEEQPNFTLRFAKRGGRAGAKDSHGHFTTSVRLRHSRVPGRISWERRSDDQDDLRHSDCRLTKGSPSRF